MDPKGYSSLYFSANLASIKTQKSYLGAIKIYLLLLIISAIITQFDPKEVIWSIFSAKRYGHGLTGMNSGKIIDALEGKDIGWCNHDGTPGTPNWSLERVKCQ
ncbi:hypothetical protein AHMF7605_23625 [Adhaeribacter arboris]|uniref:Uncharacterized protein n=1 Tax=Adhaeribacter arboris TaxID=2072846 RepID=A0A2T2YLD3_9BACT|nr:hypothetical protein [Adhaeribacter arboris]PSR56275.1 hypothetical protein AHMF7605_23625 [Adhaeribacter arboris]